MAKIEKVDYGDLYTQAENILVYGKDLNLILERIYSNIESMHANWYGQRYNTLLKEFNDMLPQINSLLVLVVGELPFALKTIANNYSNADIGEDVKSASKETPKDIADISIPNDVGMKFISTDVETTRTTISSDFGSAKEKMEKIQGVVNNLLWESDASATFAKKFSSIKTNIVASFENINSSFEKLMKQAQQDIQLAEKANTVQ